jgi:endonuclease/exonuclease/phosphatase family metal-dependent hydrolase
VGCAEDGPLGPDVLTVPGIEASASLSRQQGSAGDATVFTRNLYLGGDISRLLGASDPVAAAGAIWNEIQRSNYPARAARLAREIADLSPDLVGLQEAVRFTVGPFPATSFPQEELIDFIAVLRANLAALGHDYTVAAYQPNTRVAVPLMLGENLVTIGYQDAVAILVRSGVVTANGSGHRFAASPPASHTANIPFLRGWTQVDARVGGGWVRFVNTHLEIQSFAQIQTAQASELVSALNDSPHPVILVGDFNSAANPSAPADRKTGSYGILRAAGFDDLWARANGENTGLTCCHAADLSNTTASFNQRLDLILARNIPGENSGFAGGAQMGVVGGSVGDRFMAPQGYSLWPSDHAGVVATLRLPPGLFSVR